MFKRLRERIAEEGIKFPVGQLSNNPGKTFQDSESKAAVANSNEDLITLSDSSAVVVPHSSSHQFSIGEDEDGSFSEQNTPQRKQNDVSTTDKTVSPRDQQPATISDVNFIQEYRPSKFSYVPQSDIESEKEEPPTLNLDGISKDQLLSVIQTLKARSYKYKNKYAEVVKNYKELRDEKVKIENLLIENQDKGLRRLAELREQCQLEQKAKAHLEANLRLLLEEKDSRISVLETQINLLKEGNKSNGTRIIEDLHASNSDISSGDAKSDDGTLSLDASALQEKVERLQHQQNQDKKTITAQKDQISLLRKQNESLTQELEDKIKKLNDLEDEQVKLKSDHESILKSMQIRLEELEKQQEESVMSMAETKRNMHEELELKEKQLVKIEEESRQFQALAEKEKESVTELKRIHDEKVNDLQHQLNSLEKALEEEKQNVMQEFKRGNTATINLMQQECAKKVSAIEEEWKLKYQELEKGLTDKAQDGDITKNLETEEKLKQAEKQVEELNNVLMQLEKENASLKNSVEKLESDFDSLNLQFESLKNKCSDYDSIKSKLSVLEKLETSNGSLSVQIEKLTTINDNLNNNLNKSRITIDELNKKLEKSEIAYRELEKEKVLNGELNAKLNKQNEINNTLKNDFTNCKTKMNGIADELKSMKIINAELKRNSDSQKLFLDKQSHEFEKNKILVIELENKLQHLRKENDDLHVENEKRKNLFLEMEGKCNSLLIQIKEKTDLIEKLQSNVKDLQKQVEVDKEAKNILENVCENLRNEVQNVSSKLSGQISTAELKAEELQQVQYSLEKSQKQEKKLSEKLIVLEKVNEDFKFETSGLRSKNKLLNEKIKSLMKELKDKDTSIISNIKAEYDNLCKSYQKKEKSYENSMQTLKDIENLVEKLESTDVPLKSSVVELQNMCGNVLMQLNYIIENSNLSSIVKNSVCKDVMSPSIKCENAVSKTENNLLVKDDSATLSEPVPNSVEMFERIVQQLGDETMNNDYDTVIKHLSAENIDRNQLYDFIHNLFDQNMHLKKDLNSLKVLTEAQNVEFAKNVTQLHDSLSKLQDERNSLSLVLQSLEENQATASPNIGGKKTENAEGDINLEDSEKWQMRISELNEKVKSQIHDLSSQTDFINNELKNLREQFHSSNAAYDEKVNELNNKLLMRTEKLVGTKEDLDAAIENSECLKNLTEEFKIKLLKSEEELKKADLEKKDLEGKCKSIKDKFHYKECELKEMHNKQLNDLRNHTEATIDKLNDLLEDKNKALLQKDVDFSLEILNYDEQISNLKENLKEYEKFFLKMSGIASTYEEKMVKASETLVLLSSRIVNSDKQLVHLIAKLKEKSQTIDCLSSKLQEMSSDADSITQIKQECQNLQAELLNVRSIMEQKNSELELEKSKRIESDNNILQVKESCNVLKEEIENITNVKNNLELCLKNKSDEIDLLKTQYKENDLLFRKNESELVNLRNENSHLMQLQQEQEFSLKEVQSSLEEERGKAMHFAEEWKSVLQTCVSKIDQTSSQSNVQLDKIKMLCDEKINKLEIFGSKISLAAAKIKCQAEEIGTYKNEVYKLSTELEAVKNILNETEKKYSSAEESASKWQTKYESTLNKNTEISSVLNTLENQLKSEVDAKNFAVKALKGKTQKLTEENKRLRADLKSKGSKLQEMTSKIGEFEKDHANCEEMKSNFEKTKSKWTAMEAEFLKSVEELKLVKLLKSQSEEKCAKLEAVETELKALEDEYNSCKTLKSECEANLKKLESELILLQKEHQDCTALKERIKKLESELEVALSNVNSIQQICDSEKDKLSAAETYIVELKSKYDNTVAEIKLLSDEIENHKKQNARLLSELEAKSILIDSSSKKYALERQTEKEELQNMKLEIEKMQRKVEQLTITLAGKEEDIKRILKDQENLEAHHEENVKGMKDKLQNAEKNYKTQLEEMKNRISQLEIEKADLETEKVKLVKVEEEFTKWKNGEIKVQDELKSKEKELKVMQKKLESANQEQAEKTRTFQESMKDKENTIVKLKTQLETVVKENAEKFEELHKKIKLLEHEREQIMLQAQERVSSTEAKCREDLKSLQDRNNKLLVEVKEVEKLKTELNLLNNQLDESLLVAEANQAAADKKISELREQLAKAEQRCSEQVKAKSSTENELLMQIQKLQEENALLQCNTDSVERLKSEKEELNEKLKNAQQQIKIVNELQSEKVKFEQENKDILTELESLRPLREEKDVLQKRIEALEGNEKTLKSELTNIKNEKEKVISELQDSFNSERNSLKLANADLLKRISVLENFDPSDPQSTSLKEYIAVMRGECETAIKMKEAEMEIKLKQLVKDFCAQMDVKDKDCDQMITDMIEKSQDLEENLQKQHQLEISALRQDLFEKDCALDEMRDHYEEILLDKNKQIKEQESAIKSLSHKVANTSSYDSSQHIASEGSDWDDTWAVPDENFAENSSPIHSSKTCEEHLHQIESLQEEVSKCNSEIKELKILLRLSPPDSMVDNNNRRDSLQSIPEPTEFEYLKNIIYEYMMGKEPVTLAKVIAAVLRFSDSQTEQVIRREETRHHTR